MSRTLLAVLVATATVSAQAALPGDGPAGKRLHDANCLQCHQTEVYTKKDHAVRSLEDLKQQLRGCSHQTQKDFSDIEMQNLLKYLNDQFYKFK